ncbi:MAG: T9SS type A sorting domain-containing protein [Paludibacter sp.]|nr:T9SS type A sorting domain-containing protein [Paludibacter sp.]
MKKITTMLALLIVVGLSAQNYVEFTDGGLTYRQDFNILESTEALTNIAWTNGTSPLLGWYAAKLMQDPSPQDITVYSTGSVTTTAATGFVSFGTDADRAIGSRIANATGDVAYGVKIKNSTSVPITSLQITYSGEQWTYANPCPQVVSLAYKLNAGIKDTEFTVVPELQFSSPIFVAGVATTNKIDGNLAENKVVGITHTFNVFIPVGEYIFLRWLDINDPGTTECAGGVDHALSIDDVSVTATLQSGIHQTRNGNIKLFLSQNELVIKGAKIMKDIVIYNALGSQMHVQSVESGEITIPVNNLTRGVYFAKVTLVDGLESTISFIK